MSFSSIAIIMLGIPTAGLLLYAAWTDLRHMLIWNWVSLVVAALAAVRMVAAPETADFPWDLVWALSIFGVGVLQYYVHPIFGAGDVKLISAFSLWCGAAWSLNFLVYTALIGGVVSLAFLAMNFFIRYFELHLVKLRAWVPALDYEKATGSQMKRAFPYGLGIAIAGVMVLFEQGQSWGIF